MRGSSVRAAEQNTYYAAWEKLELIALAWLVLGLLVFVLDVGLQLVSVGLFGTIGLLGVPTALFALGVPDYAGWLLVGRREYRKIRDSVMQIGPIYGPWLEDAAEQQRFPFEAGDELGALPDWTKVRGPAALRWKVFLDLGPDLCLLSKLVETSDREETDQILQPAVEDFRETVTSWGFHAGSESAESVQRQIEKLTEWGQAWQQAEFQHRFLNVLLGHLEGKIGGFSHAVKRASRPDTPTQDIEAATKKLAAWTHESARLSSILARVIDLYQGCGHQYKAAQPVSQWDPPRPSTFRIPSGDLDEIETAYEEFQSAIDEWQNKIDAWHKTCHAFEHLSARLGEVESIEKVTVDTDIDDLWPVEDPDAVSVKEFQEYQEQADQAVDLLQEFTGVYPDAKHLHDQLQDENRSDPLIQPPGVTLAPSDVAGLVQELDNLLDSYSKWTEYAETWRETVEAREEALEAYERATAKQDHDPSGRIRQFLSDEIQFPADESSEDPYTDAVEVLRDNRVALEEIREVLDNVTELTDEWDDLNSRLEPVRERFGDDSDAFQISGPPTFHVEGVDRETVGDAFEPWEREVQESLDKLQRLDRTREAFVSLEETVSKHQEAREGWDIPELPWPTLPEAVAEAGQDLLLQGQPTAVNGLRALESDVADIVGEILTKRDELRDSYQAIQRHLERSQELAEKHNQPYVWTDRIQQLETPGQLDIARVEPLRQDAESLRNKLEGLDEEYDRTLRAGRSLDSTARVLHADPPYEQWKGDAVQALRDARLEDLRNVLQEIGGGQTQLIQTEADNLEAHRRRARDFIEETEEAIQSGVPDTLRGTIEKEIAALEKVWEDIESPIETLQDHVDQVREVEESLSTVKDLYLSEAQYYKLQVQSQDLPGADANDLLVDIRRFARQVEDGEFSQAMATRAQLRLDLTNRIFSDEMDSRAVYNLAQRINQKNANPAMR